MSPLRNQHFTVFGDAYVQERHDGFRLPPSPARGSLAPWGVVLCALLVAATIVALTTTTAAINGLTLAALN